VSRELYKAILVGATGLCGKHCLEKLLNDTDYQCVEIWVRRPTGIKHNKLDERIIDFDHLESLPDTDAQHFFCCLGTTIKKAGNQETFYKTDHDYVVSLAKIAQRSGAEKFLYISSIGANALSRNFYLRTKGKVEEDLKKAFTAGLIIFRPSMLLGKRDEFRFAELAGKTFMKVFGFLLIGKIKKYRGINASVVAEAMIRQAKTSNKMDVSILESDQIVECVSNL